MMNSESLPIYIETYRFIQEIFRCTVKFPKEYKYMLGNGLNEHALNLCCLISKANHQENKLPLLEEFFSELERVKLQLRLCVDFKLLSCTQQAQLACDLEQITSQILAWIKSERRKQKMP